MKSDNIRRLIFPDLALIGATSSCWALHGIDTQDLPAIKTVKEMFFVSVAPCWPDLRLVSPVWRRELCRGFVCYYNVNSDLVASIVGRSRFDIGKNSDAP